jgi:hypothetical protein
VSTRWPGRSGCGRSSRSSRSKGCEPDVAAAEREADDAAERGVDALDRPRREARSTKLARDADDIVGCDQRDATLAEPRDVCGSHSTAPLRPRTSARKRRVDQLATSSSSSAYSGTKPSVSARKMSSSSQAASRAVVHAHRHTVLRCRRLGAVAEQLGERGERLGQRLLRRRRLELELRCVLDPAKHSHRGVRRPARKTRQTFARRVRDCR